MTRELYKMKHAAVSVLLRATLELMGVRTKGKVACLMVIGDHEDWVRIRNQFDERWGR